LPVLKALLHRDWTGKLLPFIATLAEAFLTILLLRWAYRKTVGRFVGRRAASAGADEPRIQPGD